MIVEHLNLFQSHKMESFVVVVVVVVVVFIVVVVVFIVVVVLVTKILKIFHSLDRTILFKFH